MKKFLSDVLIECGLQVSGTTTLGTATATTVATSNNSTNIATTAFVKAQGYITSYTNNYISGLSFNTTNGVLTVTRQGLTNLTVDLDGRYLQSESDTLDTVTARGSVTTNSIGVSTVNIIGSTAGAELLTVDGTYGRLFTVTDDLSDSLFSVNTVAGLPALEVFADNTIKLGSFANPIEIDSSSNIVIPGTITASGYNDSNWNTAYNDRIASVAVSGTTNKTLTLTQGDGGTVTTTWTDNFDNYGSWNLKTNSVQRTTVQSGGDLDLIAGTDISISYSAGGKVTIASTATGSIDYISNVALNGSNLDFTGVGTAFTGAVDLSTLGYLTSYTETDTLDSVTDRGATTTNGIAVGNITVNSASVAASYIYLLSSITGESELRMGDTDTDAGSIAYNNANDFMAFRANAAERLRITSDGKVGIGTTSPTTKLHTVVDFSVSTTDYVSGTTGSRLLLKPFAATGDTYSLIQAQDVGGTSNNALVLQPYGDNVGIGTTSPGEKLQVAGTVKATGYIAQSGTPIKLIVDNGALGDSTELRTGGGSFKLYSGRTGGAHQAFVFATGDNYTSGTERMRITSAGNVGIGATDPLRKLHVVGNFAVNAGTGQYYGVNITGGEGTNPTILIGDWHNASANLTWDSTNRLLRIDAQYSTSGAPIVFSGNDAAIEYARFTATGNFGIGTASPGAKLHVEGGNTILNNGLADTILSIETDAAGNYDPVFQMGSGQNTIATEGFEIWYDNNVGDVHLSTTYINAAASIRFHTATGASKSTSNERMIITGAGNVGIGTTSPNRTLTVNGVFGIASGVTNVPELVLSADANGTYISSTYKGTSSYQPLWLETNGSPRLAITTAGNVGIGTTSPPIKLYVGTVLTGTNGNGTYASDAIAVNSGESITIGPNRRAYWGLDATTATSTTFQSKLNIWSDNEDHITFGGASTHLVSAWESFKIWINNDSGNAGTLHLYNTSSKTEFARFTGSGNNWINGGNVGIGTTAPSAKLDVIGNAYIGSTAYNNGNSSYNLRLDALDTSSIGFHDSGSTIGAITFSAAQGGFILGANHASYGPHKVRAASDFVVDGNVGIGTTSPAADLHIGNNDPTVQIGTINSTTGNAKLQFYSKNDGTANGYALQFTKGTGVDRLDFIDGSGNANIVFKNGGNVGIGTTDPGEKLHVIGNVQIEGGSTSVVLETNNKAADPVGSLFGEYDIATTYGAIVDYVIYDAGRDNMRSGTFSAVWNVGETRYNDVSTVDIGDTSVVTLTSQINGANVELIVTGDAVYTVKFNTKLIK